jgi:hypothetical protein
LVEDKSNHKIHTITKDNIDKYDINDVVLPILGSSVFYPNHKFGKEYFISMIEKDGISLDNFDSAIKLFKFFI